MLDHSKGKSNSAPRLDSETAARVERAMQNLCIRDVSEGVPLRLALPPRFLTDEVTCAPAPKHTHARTHTHSHHCGWKSPLPQSPLLKPPLRGHHHPHCRLDSYSTDSTDTGPADYDNYCCAHDRIFSVYQRCYRRPGLLKIVVTRVVECHRSLLNASASGAGEAMRARRAAAAAACSGGSFREEPSITARAPLIL